jgi:hypothetical protein
MRIPMKVGDLVQPCNRWSHREIGLGLVINVEKHFFKSGYFETPHSEDRLTVYWSHGEVTTEPQGYLRLVSESD